MAKRPQWHPSRSMQGRVSRPATAFTITRKIMAISVKAETHVIILYTTRKFVTATPTSVMDKQTDRQQKS